MLGVKIIIQFIGFGFTTLVSVATLSLSARFFGPEVLGEVNYLLGILGLLLLFSDMGFSRAHIRFVSNKKNVREKIGVFLATKLFLLFFFIVFALIYFYLAKTGKREYFFIFLILAAYEFFNRLGTSLLYTFEGLQAVTLENLAFGTGKFVKLLVLIIAIFLSRNILGLSLAYFSEGLVLVFLSFFLLKKYWPFRFNKKIFKSYFRYSLPFFVIYPLSYIQGNAGVVLLKTFWNSASVGYYSAAVGLAGFVKSMYGVVISLFFPRMSEIFSQKEFSRVTACNPSKV